MSDMPINPLPFHNDIINSINHSSKLGLLLSFFHVIMCHFIFHAALYFLNFIELIRAKMLLLSVYDLLTKAIQQSLSKTLHIEEVENRNLLMPQ